MAWILGRRLSFTDHDLFHFHVMPEPSSRTSSGMTGASKPPTSNSFETKLRLEPHPGCVSRRLRGSWLLRSFEHSARRGSSISPRSRQCISSSSVSKPRLEKPTRMEPTLVQGWWKSVVDMGVVYIWSVFLSVPCLALRSCQVGSLCTHLLTLKLIEEELMKGVQPLLAAVYLHHQSERKHPNL